LSSSLSSSLVAKIRFLGASDDVVSAVRNIQFNACY